MTDNELLRFMRFVTKAESGCWLWTGSMVHGYGQISLKQDGRWKNVRAHRASFEHFNGPLGSQMCCHRCDIKNCVNPAHLFSGTQRDNIHDAVAKGRNYCGGATVPWTRAKTHCKRGHPLSGENLSTYAKRRVCKTCMRLKWTPRAERTTP